MQNVKSKCEFCGTTFGKISYVFKEKSYCSRDCIEDHKKMIRKVIWFEERKEFSSHYGDDGFCKPAKQ